MSFVNVLPYFRARLDSLNLNEWDDGFAVDNIPATIIDRAYHLRVGLIDSQPANQQTHAFQVPVEVRVFLKGYQDPKSAINDAMSLSENIHAEVLKLANRVGRTDGILDVKPLTTAIDPLADSNDNDVIVTLTYNVNLICYFN
jgi:hypothetical protein